MGQLWAGAKQSTDARMHTRGVQRYLYLDKPGQRPLTYTFIFYSSTVVLLIQYWMNIVTGTNFQSFIIHFIVIIMFADAWINCHYTNAQAVLAVLLLSCEQKVLGPASCSLICHARGSPGQCWPCLACSNWRWLKDLFLWTSFWCVCVCCVCEGVCVCVSVCIALSLWNEMGTLVYIHKSFANRRL